jgi:hypothetical protein
MRLRSDKAPKQIGENVIRYSITRLGRVQPRDSLPTQSSEKISIWNRVEFDARGFRQDLRGSIDCHCDALFAGCYRRPYRTMTQPATAVREVIWPGEYPLPARLRGSTAAALLGEEVALPHCVAYIRLVGVIFRRER